MGRHAAGLRRAAPSRSGCPHFATCRSRFTAIPASAAGGLIASSAPAPSRARSQIPSCLLGFSVTVASAVRATWPEASFSTPFPCCLPWLLAVAIALPSGLVLTGRGADPPPTHHLATRNLEYQPTAIQRRSIGVPSARAAARLPVRRRRPSCWEVLPIPLTG